MNTFISLEDVVCQTFQNELCGCYGRGNHKSLVAVTEIDEAGVGTTFYRVEGKHQEIMRSSRSS